MSQFDKFFNLHNQDTPLLLGNVWDAHSAQIFQSSGFKAVGTSSAAIASALGLEDGENMPFDDLLRVVASIQSKIDIPLTVDIEGGYSRDVSGILSNIEDLHKLGVVGINLEDSVVETNRELVDARDFGGKIQEIKTYLCQNNIDIFVNIRTDPYMVGMDDPCSEAIKRVKIHTENGANGIFVPGVVSESEIRNIVESSALPINVMCMPGLPDFEILRNLGVKRISMGPFLYNDTVSRIKNSIQTIVEEQSFESLFLTTPSI